MKEKIEKGIFIALSCKEMKENKLCVYQSWSDKGKK